MKILVNDGLHRSGIELLEKAGYTVDTNSIPQADLIVRLNEYDAIIVRSATQVRTDLIQASPNLKVIGRGGVGLDNIDVDFAKSKNIEVLYTPAASSRSVAELAMAHLFGIVRSLPAANKAMSLDGVSDFGALKKSASKGIELQGKKLGLIGFGRIGRATASIALGCGMEILAYDPFFTEGNVTLDLHPVYKHEFSINVKTVSKEELLANADFISLHIPGGQGYVLDTPEFEQMKDGVGVVNCARGGTINEAALLAAIKSGKVKYAATDVFEKEPPVNTDILRMNAVGLSPHIGASTEEAQERVGVELAQNIINFFNL